MQLFIAISNFANPNSKYKPVLFTNVNNIWLQSTSETHVSSYKLSLFVYRPVKKLHSASLMANCFNLLIKHNSSATLEGEKKEYK